MAHIIYSAYFCNPYGGSESHPAVRWLELLLGGHEVTVITSKSSADGLHKKYGILPTNLKIIGIKVPEFWSKLIKGQFHGGYFYFNYKSVKELRKQKNIVQKADVILKKTPSSFRYYTSLYRLHIPLVIGPVGGGLQVPEKLKGYFKSEPFLNKLRFLDSFLVRIPPIRSQFKHADKILITLPYLRENLPSKYKEKMVELFDLGVDVPELNTARDNEKNTLPVNLLYVGKLIRYKGAELLIRALKEMKSSIPVHLTIVGDGSEKSHLLNLTKEMGLSSKITFTGNVDKNKVDDYYKTADIFCFPTLTEAMGAVFLEAMSYGLPVLTVNNGGPQYICPDKGSVKIEIDTPEIMVDQIAQNLDRLIANPELRKEMGLINRNHVLNQYTWEKIDQKIIGFFQQYNA